ncbi:hypothetical protein [Bacillus sp. 7884-1]|uniref:hypothetical protein n=1 Tax=Bacillus sp. 7884-1 TaxID=2021693 RepID=UPI000BA53EBB|nr:hypothetical protein [Bacillus sp. 7884-1]PAE42507.1 hypothetical protein CHI06_11205 [Bacillus sp. 7884-1]
MKQNIKAILAPMSTKERFAYIWDYYKFHIIGSITAIILLILLISSIDEKKEAYLNITILGNGVNPEGIAQLQDQLTNELVKDKADEEVFIETLSYDKSSPDAASRAGVQKMVAQITTGSIDLLIVNKELFEEISSQQNSLLAINDLKGTGKRLPSNEEVYGISTSDINLLAPLKLDENMVLCIPSNTKNLEQINELFSLISE